MESQPQNPQFLINPESFHQCISAVTNTDYMTGRNYFSWISKYMHTHSVG